MPTEGLLFCHMNSLVFVQIVPAISPYSHTLTPRAPSNVYVSFAIASIRSWCKGSAVDCLTEPPRFLVGHLSFWMANWRMVFERITVSRVLLCTLLCSSAFTASTSPERDVRCCRLLCTVVVLKSCHGRRCSFWIDIRCTCVRLSSLN